MTRRPGLVPALLVENAPFRLFWAGQIISLFGDQIALLALPLLAVLLLHAGPREMGYLSSLPPDRLSGREPESA